MNAPQRKMMIPAIYFKMGLLKGYSIIILLASMNPEVLIFKR